MLRRLLACFLLMTAPVTLLFALVTHPMVMPEHSASLRAEPARLRAHVERLSVDLYPRHHAALPNLNNAAIHILAEFARTGAPAIVQTFEIEGRAYQNVIARFGPAGGPLVVVGAHYDSFGNTPGADDNASGVAGLLELAQLLTRAPPSQPVELVAYTLEEPPHFRTANMGSAHHARELKLSGREVALMISLEMIGYFDDRPGSQHYPLPGMEMIYPDRGDFIALVGHIFDPGNVRRAKALMSGASDLPLESINTPASMQGVDFSDHLNYWAEGIPAVMFTDTAFFRNPNYHGSGDTAETLDYIRMAKVVEGVAAVARGFGDSRKRPLMP